jgi:hypothetical protein
MVSSLTSLKNKINSLSSIKEQKKYIKALRKQVLKDTIISMLNSFHPQMSTVLCKDDLVTEATKVETLMYSKTDIDIYANQNSINIISSIIMQKNKLQTLII